MSKRKLAKFTIPSLDSTADRLVVCLNRLATNTEPFGWEEDSDSEMWDHIELDEFSESLRNCQQIVELATKIQSRITQKFVERISEEIQDKF